MQIIITGGAGFIGQKLAKALSQSSLPFQKLLLLDIGLPSAPTPDPRIHCHQADICQPNIWEQYIGPSTQIVYHLAAVVSSHAEANFELGYQVNLAATTQLLEACRRQSHAIRLVFASSCAVFGGQLPSVVTNSTALTPASSYGTQKAMAELLVADYTRKGYLHGLSLRLPTVCVRPGKPNLAASSFVSGIMREPIAGQAANCPVPTSLALWITSPNTVVHNLAHAATLAQASLNGSYSLNLPGISVTIAEMIASLHSQVGSQATQLISYQPNPAISQIVQSWPSLIDNQPAQALGFKADASFHTILQQYLAEL
jgi:D-erythronate 2-dehydrogenase